MKEKKSIFLTSFLLFLLTYTNNYTSEIKNITINKDGIELLLSLNKEELRRLILKVRIEEEKQLSKDSENNNDNYLGSKSSISKSFLIYKNIFAEQNLTEENKAVIQRKSENKIIKNKILARLLVKKLE